MASGTYYPAVDGDDGIRQGGTSFYLTWVDGHIGRVTDASKIFIRFPNVTIPSGVTISTAFVRFKSRSTTADAVCSEELSFNDVDDAVAPTTYGEFDDLVKTSAKVTWIVGAWTNNTQHDSDDIATPLQEIIDRAGWSSGNAVMLIGDGTASDAYADRTFDQYDSNGGADKAELHVTWATVYEGEVSENVNVTSEFDDNFGSLDEDVNVNSEFACFVADFPISEDVSVNSEITYFEADSPVSNNASVNSKLIAEYTGEISEEVSINLALAVNHQQSGETSEEASVNSAFVAARYLKIQDTLSAWGTLKWGWNKTIIDSLAIADTASKILGVSVKEWLTLIDTEIANWNGVESVSDSFYTVDILKVVKVYEDLLADGMTVIDAIKISLGLILIDILTCADTLVSTWAGSRSVSSSFGITDTTLLIKIYNDLVADGMAAVDAVSLALELVIADRLKAVDSVQGIGIFQYLIEDGMTLEDIARRFFPKSVSDSFAIADTSLVDFLVLLQISDSFDAADTTSRLLTINQIIADSLKVLDVVTVQQLIQELIQEGLNFAVSVTIDGEVWECWVLNTSSFHPSVYSNYEFNSFAIDRSNNICYGCKSDGIYTLEGSTDNGTPIRAGIILPKSDFGLMNNKKMRKAWFAVDDDNLILKLETESGDRTFKMIDAECSLTRDLKGRRWEISVEGFESIDSLNLVPVILSRK